MSEAIVTYRGTIYPWHCDHMGHMNVMWYIGKFDEASWQLLSLIGLTRSRFEHDASGMAAVEQHVYYKRELYTGEVVSIHSTILEVRDKSIRFRHEMRRDETGEIASITEITGVHIDAVARKGRSLPEDVRERALRLLVSTQEGGSQESAPTLLEVCSGNRK